jgi:hypothetical protein
MLFDILPFWGLAVACFAEGECGKAMAVAIIGPARVILDGMMCRAV